MKYLTKAIYILIFLVMVTSPYAGHTYAEYARQATGSDEARTANFGVTVTATENSFYASYGTPDVTVQSANGTDKVIAPGTAGTFCEVTTSGTPEVRTMVTKDAEVSLNDSWTNDSGTFYCPIVFTFNSGNDTWDEINGLDYDSKEALEAAIEENLELGNGAYGTGYSFSTGTNSYRHNTTVYWRWPFETGKGTKINQTMENDNALGNKATLPTISVSFNVTIEQVD